MARVACVPSGRCGSPAAPPALIGRRPERAGPFLGHGRLDCAPHVLMGQLPKRRGADFMPPVGLPDTLPMAYSSGGRPGRRLVGRALHQPEECATSLFHTIRHDLTRRRLLTLTLRRDCTEEGFNFCRDVNHRSYEPTFYTAGGTWPAVGTCLCRRDLDAVVHRPRLKGGVRQHAILVALADLCARCPRPRI